MLDNRKLPVGAMALWSPGCANNKIHDRFVFILARNANLAQIDVVDRLTGDFVWVHIDELAG